MLVQRAAKFAAYVHRNQKRKYSGEPYFVHLAEVAQIVASVGGSEEMIAAAYLHDTIEDQEVTEELIAILFGANVAQMVVDLTDVQLEVGNRKYRKSLDRQRLADAKPESQTIKLADLISNTKSILQDDPDFAVVFLQEAKLYLDVLKEGNITLFEQLKLHLERK